MNLQTEMDFEMPSGRTSSAFCQTKETPSDASLQGLWAQMPPSNQVKSQQMGNPTSTGDGAVLISGTSRFGHVTVWSLDQKAVPRGLPRTPNFLESPNDAAVCSLSQILETGPIPPRFFLSPKACSGI